MSSTPDFSTHEKNDQPVVLSLCIANFRTLADESPALILAATANRLPRRTLQLSDAVRTSRSDSEKPTAGWSERKSRRVRRILPNKLTKLSRLSTTPRLPATLAG